MLYAVKQFPRESARADKEREPSIATQARTNEQTLAWGLVCVEGMRALARSRTLGPYYPGDYGKVTSCQGWRN